MKKIIATGLSVAMVMGLSGNAFAEETASAPALIYNNMEISGDTADSIPFIENDRTMLPFRYLLEQIGATVDYDEANRLVSAEKDGISIEFSLDDTYIDVTKNGSTQRVIQDTENIIRDDRVFVPIRFISEAFGLNVGWDSYERAAVIVDMQEYARELLENSPKLKQYIDITSNIPDNYTETVSMTFDFSVKAPAIDAEFESGDTTTSVNAEDVDINLSFGIDGELSLNEGAVSSDITADLDTNLFEELGDIGLSTLEDVQFTFMYNDGKFYAKTNLVDKLKEVAPDNEFLNNVSFVVTSDTWFEADIYELFDRLGLPEEMIDVVKASLGTDVNGNYFEQSMGIMPVTITSVADAQAIDMVMDLYADMFEQMITITDNGDGNYEVAINYTKDDFMNMIEQILNSQLASMGESQESMQAAIDEISNALEFEITGTTTVENNIATAAAVVMNMAMDTDGVSMKMNMSVDSTLTPNTDKEIVIPETTLNLIDVLDLLM